MIAARWLLAAALLAAFAPIAAAGCGETVRLGDTGPGPDPRCMGAPCGTTCTIRSCAADASACTEPGYCDPTTNACLPTPPMCPPPCQGQPCGAPCDPPCKEGDPGCVMGGSGRRCDGMGACVDGPLVCGCMGPGCPPGWQPCEGRACGVPCSLCDPMNPTCPTPEVKTVCDGMGACVPAMGLGCAQPPPPFDPCMGKKCGEPCDPCPPGDPMCMNPPGPAACDDHGMCVMGPLACPGPPDAGP